MKSFQDRSNSVVTAKSPEGWSGYAIFDSAGFKLQSAEGASLIDFSGLAAGSYVLEGYRNDGGVDRKHVLLSSGVPGGGVYVSQSTNGSVRIELFGEDAPPPFYIVTESEGITRGAWAWSNVTNFGFSAGEHSVRIAKSGTYGQKLTLTLSEDGSLTGVSRRSGRRGAAIGLCRAFCRLLGSGCGFICA
ncbi:hypothetical protein [Roseovarius sp. ZX-A-9]|uniref:hypothetical protein n=1 Tax=Roseovarius sp. ZX-A-9 TaxID=3014783 RepID=UPI00232C6CDB|nr:hypothetical protein [Roseovarius sp. ZX-A-9]